MTGMKDYVDEMLDELEEAQEQEEPTPDFEGSHKAEVCPFCQNEDLMIGINRKEAGKDYLYLCMDCMRSWLVSINSETGDISAGEVNLESPPDSSF